MPWLRGNHANPSGSYRAARVARAAIEEARERVARLIGADAGEIAFTGSGTESVNAGLHSFDELCPEGHALVSKIEHSAVLRWVEGRARGVKLAPVDAGGRVDVGKLGVLMEGAGYVSVMAANNETGVMQPIGEISRIAKGAGLAVHCDAVQMIGKGEFDVGKAGVDMASLSGHKFHGPKGIGVLYVRGGLDFTPYLRGGGQEGGRRSGTENTAGIVGLGMAAEMAAAGLRGGVPQRIGGMRDHFEKRVMEGVAGCVRNGDPVWRLPHTSHLSFERCDAGGLLILLDAAGVCCSAGSACMTGKSRPSHVQLAMGIPEERARTSLRFSFSRLNEMEEAEEAAALTIRAVEKLRSVQGEGTGPVAIYS